MLRLLLKITVLLLSSFLPSRDVAFNVFCQLLGDSVADPLFYRRVVPLDSRVHSNLKISSPDKPLAYAQAANVIPALVEEFASAATEMPIAFVPGADHPSAVFVVGLRPGTNLFIDDTGRWVGTYVPAYLRRYPFIIGDPPEGEPILCIDAEYDGLGEDAGAPLFNEEGRPGEAVTQALAFSQSYKQSADRTDAACRKLKDMGLFRPVTLDARLPSGQSTVVHGLLIVDEDALNALPADKLAELHADRLLKPVFAHLTSLGALSRLGDKEHAKAAAQAAA
jgi:hypothetical protein